MLQKFALSVHMRTKTKTHHPIEAHQQRQRGLDIFHAGKRADGPSCNCYPGHLHLPLLQLWPQRLLGVQQAGSEDHSKACEEGLCTEKYILLYA